MKIKHSKALIAALIGSASILPFMAQAEGAAEPADAATAPKEIIVVGQKNAPITVVPRGLSVSLGKEQFAAINATNVEDLMKYAPNFFVRKRFAGDDNAVVALRGANTVQSARTLVLVDGYVVSNFLGNRYDYPPKWNVVGPSEVRQFDIVYGPYSARYGGNSMGGVVSISTDTPKKNDSYVTLQTFFMPFKEYGFNETFKGYSVEGGLNYKPKDSPWSLRTSFRHFDNVGQSMTYNLLTKASPTAAQQSSYIPVTGAYTDSRLATPVYGAASPVHVLQDQARLRVGYQANNGWKADAMLVYWQTSQSLTDARTWLTDASGNPVYTTAAGVKVKFNGEYYTAKGVTYSALDRQEYLTGFKLSGPFKGWDVSANLSHYAISKWESQASGDLVTGRSNGAGTNTVYKDPGWWTFDSVAERSFGRHDIAIGATSNLYQTDSTTYTTTNWRTATNPVYASRTFGKTTISGVFAEDEIDLNGPVMTLGVRFDDWRAFDGGLGKLNGTSVATADYPKRHDSSISPKFSIQSDVGAHYNLQVSLGTATRFPTVGELFQGSLVNGVLDTASYDPNLKPEVSTDISLILRRSFKSFQLTGSVFGQDIKDSIFSYQGMLEDGTIVSRYQNIDRMRQYGIELIYESHDLFIQGLDIESGLSWMDARTVRNKTATASEGVQFPRIPKWRYNGNVRYALTPKLRVSVGWRYSSRPNSDLFGLVRGGAYGFQTEYAFVDTKLTYDLTPKVQVSVGIDNINNDQAYVSHPLPQRSYMLELKYKG